MKAPAKAVEVQLRDLCQSITDGDHQAPPRAESGVPFITISAMRKGSVDLDSAVRFVPPAYAASLDASRKPKAGDVLYSVTGSIGLSALVSDRADFVFQRHIAIIRPDQSICDPRWLSYILASPQVREQAKTVATGTAQLTVPLAGLRSFKVPLSSLTRQRDAVAKLDALNARISRARAELNRISTLAKNFRKQSLKLAYSGKLTADWRGEVQSSKHERPLPATWHSLLLGDIADVKSGITLGKKRTVGDRLIELPYLRVANVQRGTLNLGVVKRVLVTPGEADMLYLQPGDILMNEGGDRDKLGRGCVWNGEIRNCIHQNHVFRVRLKSPDILPRYISHYTNEFGSEYFFQHGTQTTNLASLSKTKLSALPLPLAPIDEQAEILNRLETAFARADRLEGEATRAAALLDRLEASILAKAFRGELVPQDPADEPASALLDRIHAERAEDLARPRRRRARGGTATTAGYKAERGGVC